MTTTVVVKEDKLQAEQSPVSAIETETLTFAVVWWDTATSPAATCYVNKQDKTSTLMPAGSHTASGSTTTLKPLVLSALTGLGGKRVVVNASATVGGTTRTRQIVVIVRKDEIG